MDAETLQLEIKKMENELLALKQTQKVASTMNAYVMSKSQMEFGRYTITYQAGDQPIMTEFYCTHGDVISASPVGNAQYFWFSSQVYGKVTAVSTRKIISIVKS